ncbi:MAG TPA: hypothetical protein VHT73_11895 [Thermodesulfobacteriota bacterium]|nr:hypothetical protein [Thermodesulfobacteriota bacterium]
MNSVIKRKFGGSIREEKERYKKRVVSLMAVVYNIHVIVREAKIRPFIALLYLLQKIDACDKAITFNISMILIT